MERYKVSLLQEFKKFIVRGNVIDLAVGIIIGGAFSNIVNSVVRDLIMPIVGLATGGIDFSQKFIRLGHFPANFKGNPHSFHDLQTAGVAVFGYGNFITVLLNFLILAVIIFFIVKLINTLRAQLDVASEAAAPSVPEDVVLLREIRDALQAKSK